jgi:hypothetical protein
MTRTLALLAATLLLACQVGTQVLAYQARYSPRLGVPLLTRTIFFTPHSLYAPWQGIGWAWRWGGQAPQMLWKAGKAMLIPLGLGVLCCLPRRRQGWHRGQPPAMTGHGTTQWAKRSDLKRSGLL